MEKVALEHNKTLAPLADNLLLTVSGLDSLCFAILITRLDDMLGVDPFADGDVDSSPETIGELITNYERLIAKVSGENSGI